MNDLTTRTANRRLTAILFLALALRVGVLIATVVSHDGFAACYRPDSHSYVQLAQHMAFAGQFTNAAGQAEIRRTPGYPLLMVPGTWLGHVELVTLCLQIILSTLTVLLVYRMAKLLFDSRSAAQLCALLAAIEPLSIIYSSYLLTETLFTFLIVISVFQLIVYLKHQSFGNLVYSALGIAAATYVRPASYFLAPMLAGLLCLRCFARPRQPARALRHAVALGVISMTVIGLWQVRNHAQTGYHRFSAISDHAIYYFHAASIAAQLNGKTGDQQRDDWGFGDREVLYGFAPQLRGAGMAAKHNYMHDQGVRLITKHPARFANIYAQGMARTLLAPGSLSALELTGQLPDDYRSKHRETLAQHGTQAGIYEMGKNHPLVFLVTGLCIAFLLGYYLLCVAAVFNYRQLLNMPMAVVLSVGVYLILVAGGVIGTHRYRTPAMPLVCIVAGLGLSSIARRMTRTRDAATDQSIDADAATSGAERHLDAA